MKRSHINEIVREADAFIASHGFALPPFAHWTADEMIARHRAGEIGGIVDARLGWDITDYGAGEFDRMGLTLFTTRNGSLADLRSDGGPGANRAYAEKIMIWRRNQISPMHRHVVKAEDIINRGGATLAIEMFASDANGAIDRDAPVYVRADGMKRTFPPGGTIHLAPGESVTLMAGNWHKFWGEGGDVLIGEVSTVNDDETDNIFEEPIGRFAAVEEDEPPHRLLVSDYATWLRP